MTLTEFLLARIAEDERMWQTWGGPLPHVPFEAECEAKRQIVEVCRVLSDDSSDSAWWSVDKAEAILAALALPYADHPEYDKGWKP